MNTTQTRSPLDMRHKILLGACIGCLALGYVMGRYHAASDLEHQFLRTLNKKFENF